MNKIFTLLLVVLSFSQVAFGQTILTQWNFNSTTSDADVTTGTTTPSIGLGTISLVGSTTATFATGNVSDPASGGNDNSAYNTATYPALGTGTKTAGIEIAVSTVGFTGISIAWQHRHSNTSANTVVFQYSTNGSTFNDLQSFTFTPASTGTGDTWYNRSIDLSSISALNNNPNAKFRIVSAFDAGTGNYLASRSTSSYATTGTYRFDMVTISYNAVFPVELMSFNAEKQCGQVKLTWQTASEKNNAHFNVQRSHDGQHFTTIGQVKGVGTSQNIQKYKFDDATPLVGLNYYRLEQVDFDGTTTISASKSIVYGKKNKWTLSSTLVGNALTLSNAQPTEGVVLGQIVDILGRPVQQFKASNETTMTVNVAELTAGHYFVRVGDAVLRFVKL